MPSSRNSLAAALEEMDSSIEARMASPHALVRTQGMTFAGLQSGADLAVIEQQGS